jgi:hypothetical protein
MEYGEYKEKHSSVLAPGVTQGNLYVVLCNDKDRAVHLGLLPIMYREGGTVFVGGKLRSAVNSFYGLDPKEPKVPSVGDPVKALRRAFGGIGNWANEHQVRCSVTYGQHIAAGVHDKDEFFKQFPANKLASDVVESLEKIGNGWKCSPRRKVISALADHYAVHLPRIFEETPVDHAGEQLGKTTGFGAITQKKHMDKVGSLVSSVK